MSLIHNAQHIVAVLQRDDLFVNEQTLFEAAKRYANDSDASIQDKKSVLSAVRLELLPFDYLWTTVRKFAEERKLLSIEDLTSVNKLPLLY